MNTLNNKRIFIVEDDSFYRNIIFNYISDREEEVILECFSSAHELLANLYKNPDIIFLDYNLEDKTGLEILREVKAINPEIYVVFLSAQETIQVAVEALRYGALEYIVKDDEVFTKIDHVLSNILRLDLLIEENKKSRKVLGGILFVLFFLACTLTIWAFNS